jgi:hypothetical protein
MVKSRQRSSEAAKILGGTELPANGSNSFLPDPNDEAGEAVLARYERTARA